MNAEVANLMIVILNLLWIEFVEAMSDNQFFAKFARSPPILMKFGTLADDNA